MQAVDKVGVFVSIVSTKIPFKGAGKEYIGDDIPEMVAAVKSAIQVIRISSSECMASACACSLAHDGAVGPLRVLVCSCCLTSAALACIAGLCWPAAVQDRTRPGSTRATCAEAQLGQVRGQALEGWRFPPPRTPLSKRTGQGAVRRHCSCVLLLNRAQDSRWVLGVVVVAFRGRCRWPAHSLGPLSQLISNMPCCRPASRSAGQNRRSLRAGFLLLLLSLGPSRPALNGVEVCLPRRNGPCLHRRRRNLPVA
jgi:hypothetical protein